MTVGFSRPPRTPRSCSISVSRSLSHFVTASSISIPAIRDSPSLPFLFAQEYSLRAALWADTASPLAGGIYRSANLLCSWHAFDPRWGRPVCWQRSRGDDEEPQWADRVLHPKTSLVHAMHRHELMRMQAAQPPGPEQMKEKRTRLQRLAKARGCKGRDVRNLLCMALASGHVKRVACCSSRAKPFNLLSHKNPEAVLKALNLPLKS